MHQQLHLFIRISEDGKVSRFSPGALGAKGVTGVVMSVCSAPTSNALELDVEGVLSTVGIDGVTRPVLLFSATVPCFINCSNSVKFDCRKSTRVSIPSFHESETFSAGVDWL